MEEICRIFFREQGAPRDNTVPRFIGSRGGGIWWSISGVAFGRSVSGGASDGINLTPSTIFSCHF